MLSYLCGSSRKILPIINLPETEFQYENEKVIRLFFLHFTYYMFFLLFLDVTDVTLTNICRILCTTVHKAIKIAAG